MPIYINHRPRFRKRAIEISDLAHFSEAMRPVHLEAIMDDGDLSSIEVHPLEQQEALRLIPILMFGGVDGGVH